MAQRTMEGNPRTGHGAGHRRHDPYSRTVVSTDTTRPGDGPQQLLAGYTAVQRGTFAAAQAVSDDHDAGAPLDPTRPDPKDTSKKQPDDSVGEGAVEHAKSARHASNASNQKGECIHDNTDPHQAKPQLDRLPLVVELPTIGATDTTARTFVPLDTVEGAADSVGDPGNHAQVSGFIARLPLTVVPKEHLQQVYERLIEELKKPSRLLSPAYALVANKYGTAVTLDEVLSWCTDGQDGFLSILTLRCITGVVPMDPAESAGKDPKVDGFYTKEHAENRAEPLLLGQLPNGMGANGVAAAVGGVTGHPCTRVDVLQKCGIVKGWLCLPDETKVGDVASRFSQISVATQAGVLVGAASSPQQAAETRRQLTITRLIVDTYTRVVLEAMKEENSNHPIVKVFDAHVVKEDAQPMMMVVSEVAAIYDDLCAEGGGEWTPRKVALMVIEGVTRGPPSKEDKERRKGTELAFRAFWAASADSEVGRELRKILNLPDTTTLHVNIVHLCACASKKVKDKVQKLLKDNAIAASRVPRVLAAAVWSNTEPAVLASFLSGETSVADFEKALPGLSPATTLKVMGQMPITIEVSDGNTTIPLGGMHLRMEEQP